MKIPIWVVSHSLALAMGAVGLPNQAKAQDNALPKYLRDRGTGIPTSLFGTYIDRGQLLIYPFFAYSLDRNREYQPSKLGFGLEGDFRGKYRSSEELIFVAYGLTDRWALEFETAYLNASLEKSTSDTSTVPSKIKESGIGDIEGQVRWRWMSESVRHPEMFSFLEITVPSQKNKLLIGDSDWDFRPGIGIIRGFSWGTMTLRTDLEYNRESSNLDIGETAVEYLKRLSPLCRLYLGIEGGEGGAPDEWVFISGIQWRITDQFIFKFDNAVGIMSKATDWAPEIGLVFSFPN